MTEKLLPSGFFFIDKDYGITSHDVVSKMRKILNTKKIGHAGTLDPMATGVLAMGVGTSTRLLDYVQSGIKTYIAEIKFGEKTTTGDVEGDIIETVDMSGLNLEVLEKACREFVGIINQIPPMTSAVKVDGKALYKYARAGKEVERKVRSVEIYSIKILSGPSTDPLGEASSHATLEIICSVGTYIRTLAEDIAVEAGGVAHLSNLRRIKSGTIAQENLITLEELASADDPFQFMCDPAKALSHYKTLIFDENQVDHIYKGQLLRLNEAQANELQAESDQYFVGLGELPRKLIAMYDNPYNDDVEQEIADAPPPETKPFDYKTQLLKSRCVIFLDL
ncbi:MAG: tRNA pseudouridine(55) synthase TruB [Acidimicrobiia bacterium]|nr:tRNA pseudouridine(55) synthase TruB [Acidimicrobiia bacterium]